MRKLLIILFCIPILGISQQDSTTRVAIVDGDTMLYDILPAVPVGPGATDFWEKYNHAKYFVPKIYHYAILAKELTAKYEKDLDTIKGKRAKKKYLSAAKKKLKTEFGPYMHEMSVTRSFYMFKLIERETGQQAYEILEEYLGVTKATLWQGIARLGGANTKQDYDPFGEDGYIELVVRQIEDGKLPYEKHEPLTEEGKQALKERRKREKKETKKRKKEFLKKQKEAEKKKRQSDS